MKNNEKIKKKNLHSEDFNVHVTTDFGNQNLSRVGCYERQPSSSWSSPCDDIPPNIAFTFRRIFIMSWTFTFISIFHHGLRFKFTRMSSPLNPVAQRIVVFQAAESVLFVHHPPGPSAFPSAFALPLLRSWGPLLSASFRPTGEQEFFSQTPSSL